MLNSEKLDILNKVEFYLMAKKPLVRTFFGSPWTDQAANQIIDWGREKCGQEVQFHLETGKDPVYIAFTKLINNYRRSGSLCLSGISFCDFDFFDYCLLIRMCQNCLIFDNLRFEVASNILEHLRSSLPLSPWKSLQRDITDSAKNLEEELEKEIFIHEDNVLEIFPKAREDSIAFLNSLPQKVSEEANREKVVSNLLCFLPSKEKLDNQRCSITTIQLVSCMVTIVSS